MARRLDAGIRISLGSLMILAACGRGDEEPRLREQPPSSPSPNQAPPVTRPADPAPAPATTVQVAPGVTLEQTQLPSGEQLWIYTPRSDAGGVKDVVLVAPAGSNLMTGMKLSEGDRPEHLPYVEAGYAVFAYELPGAPPDTDDGLAIFAAMGDFRTAQAGSRTAAAVLDEATRRFPAQLADGALIAGHSSAATHALYVASREPRIRAVAAYAPVIDVPAYLGSEVMEELNRGFPGYAEFLAQISPINVVEELAPKPVFLFSAKDDSLVEGQGARLHLALSRAKNEPPPTSKHLEVSKGGHYSSMLEQGIPAAIEWFGQL